MKLTGIKFLILYFFLYILLPCGVDVKCEEDAAMLNVCAFNIDDNENKIGHDHHYDGRNIYQYFKFNTRDFELYLKEVLDEIRKLKKKNTEDIQKGVNLGRRGIAFNKRVLAINIDQVETVFEVLGDELGCQECPVFLVHDKKNEIKTYAEFTEFASEFLKNDKKEDEIVQSPLIQIKDFLNSFISENEKIFDILNSYYSKDRGKREIITEIAKLREDIFTDIKTLKKKGLLKKDDETKIITKNKYIEPEDENFFEEIDVAKIETEYDRACHVINFEGICEKYEEVENKILKSSTMNKEVLEEYLSWRATLLKAQMLRALISLFGYQHVVNENKKYIKKNLIFCNIPENFTKIYNIFFFSDEFPTENLFDMLKRLGETDSCKTALRWCKSADSHDDTFAIRSLLDWAFLFFEHKEIIDTALLIKKTLPFLPKNENSDTGIFVKIKDRLEELKKGSSLFAKKKSVLFEIIKKTASCKKEGFNEKEFYELDEKIKDHFNSIIINYLNNILKMVESFKDDEQRKGVTYDFHNANVVYEFIRAFTRYIAPVLERKEGRQELIYNGILILQDALKTLNMSASVNRILMECSLVLNILMEYFIYVKDFNAYISQKSMNKELTLKRNNISNKLDSFCLINTDDYTNLTNLVSKHEGNAPDIINAVAQRLYEYGEDKKRNNPYFNIVVMGDMRAGKTLLIRSLFDEGERFKFKVASGDTSTTSKITSYTRTYNDTEEYIQITDTPGFEGVEKKDDRGHIGISNNFDNLFNGDDNTIVVDIVLFKDGCINWLSESHKDIVTQILDKKENKIIFLIPFTGLKKNAKKIKEKFLASLFYNLYVRGNEFPAKEENISSYFKKFMERIIAIPINQIHSEEDNESRFGLETMGKTIIKLFKQQKCVDEDFKKAFIKSLPANKHCKNDIEEEKEEEEEEEEKEEEKEEKEVSDELKNFNNIINEENDKKEIRPSKSPILLDLLCSFNNFNFKIDIEDEDFKNLSDKDFKIEIDKKCFWHTKDKDSYNLLKYIYLFYTGFSSLINQFCTKSYDPLMYEIYETEMYRLAEFITSPYFFNYLCLSNEKLGYNIFLFEEEIILLNKKELLEKILEKQKTLARFCLVADNPFLISEGDYETIKKACEKFNSNYKGIKPLSSVKNAMETNYNQIKKKLDTYFDKKGENIGEQYLNFVVCYDPTQRRYILDRTNLCFLEIKLERDEKNKLYEIIPESLKGYIKDLNGAINEIKSYDDFLKIIEDKNNKGILYRRYHHLDKKRLIREIELNRIREVLSPREKEEKKSVIEEEEEKEEKELVIDEEKEDKTIDEIKGDEIIEEEDNVGILGNIGNILSGFKKFKNLFLNPPSDKSHNNEDKSANNEDESPSSNKMAEVIEKTRKAYEDMEKVINNNKGDDK